MPFYRALATGLEELIRSGRIAPGTQLPAEHNLGLQLNVSRGVVIDDTTLLETQFDGAIAPPLAAYADAATQRRIVTVAR